MRGGGGGPRGVSPSSLLDSFSAPLWTFSSDGDGQRTSLVPTFDLLSTVDGEEKPVGGEERPDDDLVAIYQIYFFGDRVIFESI